MATTRPSSRLTAAAALAGLLLVGACGRKGGCAGDYCGTLVIATAGEPDILLPPVSEFSSTREVTEQLFLKLADLGPSGNTIGDEDFQPLLAERWEWDTPTTLVFHLDPRARWQDGRRVTAADVAFTYDIYTDSLVSSPYRPSLRQISAVTTRDSLTVVFRFRQRYPVMFYDAVYHMRILPSHLLRPATPPSRTRCSATVSCGAPWRWPPIAATCCTTCSATWPRSRRALCRSSYGSGTPRSVSSRTTAPAPRARSRGWAGPTRTATASAIARVIRSPSGCSSRPPVPCAASTRDSCRSSFAPWESTSSSTRSTSAYSVSGPMPAGSMRSSPCGTPTRRRRPVSPRPGRGRGSGAPTTGAMRTPCSSGWQTVPSRRS